MFAAALAIRLALAPAAGFHLDLGYFGQWADRLHDVGYRHFYTGDTTFDYPPGYLYVLALLGSLSRSPNYLLLKLPAILGDLALAWMCATFAVRLAPDELRQRIPVRAAVAAAVLFNPALIALSAVWGQVDVVPATFVVGSLLLLLTGRTTARRDIAAVTLFAVAFSMKPQSSFLFPALGYALYRHHIHRRPSLELRRGIATIVAAGVSGLALWLVTALPFGLGPSGLLAFYSKASNGYKITSVWAFNLWGAVGFWRGDVRHAAYPVELVAGIPAFYMGFLAYAAGTGYVLWRAHRAINRGHNEARVLLAAATMTSLLAFTVLTRMHERYMFPVLACVAPLVIWREFRRIYAALSVLFLLNLWFPFAVYNRQFHVATFQFEPVFSWVFGNIDTFDHWQQKMWSGLMVVACVALVTRGFGWIEKLDDRNDLFAEVSAGDPGAARVKQGRPPPASAPPKSNPPVVRRRKPGRLLPVTERATTVVEPDESRSWLRLLPLGLVLVACVFNLVTLRGETTPASNLNDSAFHMEMVRWADHQIGEGKIPLDGWFPNLSLGSSFFHHYQSLPYTITAYAARITGLGDQTTYLWFLYLLLALWPISVYLGARLLSLERWPAAAAALLAPLIVSVTGYGYEHASYTWQGLGVYTQLFGMWLLPLAWGLTWRAVSKGERYALTALVLALTIATHLMTGYLALLTIVVWVLLRWRGIVLSVSRAAVVAVGAIATAAWVLVPLFADRNYSAQSAFYKGSIFNDSYGARKILGWLFSGQLFDHKRLPVFTLLVAVGFVMCAIRAARSEAARAVLGAWTLSLLLFFGRATFGSLVKVLPGSGDLQMHRFMVGVDLAGILLAGVGLVAIADWIRIGLACALDAMQRAQLKPVALSAATALVIVVVLAPAWTQIADYDAFGASLIRSQRTYDAQDGADFSLLVKEAEIRGGGRIYAGTRANWGTRYKIGSVQAFAHLENDDADAIGYPFRTVQSLSTDVDASFDETIPAQYQIMNMKYVILPSNRKPAVPAKLLDEAGRHRLYEVGTTGYFQVIDIIDQISANRTNLRETTREFRYSDRATHDEYPAVAFNGTPAAEPTYTSPAPPPGPAGIVVEQHDTDATDGSFRATVRAFRPAAVLLKESFDPRWSVTIDGSAAKPVMLAPSLVGVEVPAGTHEIAFQYKKYPHYPLLVAIGVGTLLGLAIWPRRDALAARVRGPRAAASS